MLIFLLNFFSTCLIYTSNSYILETSSIIFRHGDRSPIWIYPTDSYKESFWRFGLGQLTNKGINQEYDLGQYLRKRYIDEIDFLNKSYLNNQVKIRSTDYDRTLMSAQSVLAGMFPPNRSNAQEQNWNQQLNWQPIPIHTIPVSKDYLLCAGGACELFKIMEKQLWQVDSEAITINEKNKVLFKYLAEKSGLNILALNNLDILVDPLICQHSHNLSLPTWLNTSVLATLFELHDKRFQINYKYEKMQVLAVGTLLAEIVHIMTLKIKELEGQNISDPIYADYKPKFHMYSGHDTTLTGLLSALQAFDHNPIKFPSYASTIFLELYSSTKGSKSQISHHPSLKYLNDKPYKNLETEDEGEEDNDGGAFLFPDTTTSKDYFIRIFYRNSHLNISAPGSPLKYTVQALKLPGCPDDYCPFDVFVNSLKDKFPVNIEKQCSNIFLQTYCHKGRTNWAACFIIFPVLLIASVILLSWGIIVWTIKRKSNFPTLNSASATSSNVPYMPIPFSEPTANDPLL